MIHEVWGGWLVLASTSGQVGNVLQFVQKILSWKYVSDLYVGLYVTFDPLGGDKEKKVFI